MQQADRRSGDSGLTGRRRRQVPFGGTRRDRRILNSPESDFAGLAAAIAYYNSAENVESDWFAFIADRSGTIVDHYH